MKKKKVKYFIKDFYKDYGYGFPIMLKNVEIEVCSNKETPIINLVKLENELIKRMPNRITYLTGAELKFIRLYFEMTRTSFGKLLGVSQKLVKKLEISPINIRMDWTKETFLRLYIANKIGYTDKEFKKLFIELLNERSIDYKHNILIIDLN